LMAERRRAWEQYQLECVRKWEHTRKWENNRIR
jgi:hypothetical protein